jgi:hypothetical protein
MDARSPFVIPPARVPAGGRADGSGVVQQRREDRRCASLHAPEQVRGGELGPAADMWGLGAVLFEAAPGEPAFDDPDAEELDDAQSDTPSDVSDGP